MATLKKPPSEQPMLKSLITLLNENEIIKCQFAAIMRYHEKCAAASRELYDELRKCSEELRETDTSPLE
jgi:Cdc6-like AAA superfamily ATPase